MVSELTYFFYPCQYVIGLEDATLHLNFKNKKLHNNYSSLMCIKL